MARPMVLRGTIWGRHVNVMITTGASHNFISSAVVSEMGLRTSPTRARVRGLVGPANETSGKVLGLTITFDIEQYVVTGDFYAVKMAYFDAFLGMAWFNTLGTISFDYCQNGQTMEFQMYGQRVLLRSDPRIPCPENFVSVMRLQEDAEASGDDAE